MTGQWLSVPLGALGEGRACALQDHRSSAGFPPPALPPKSSQPVVLFTLYMS